MSRKQLSLNCLTLVAFSFCFMTAANAKTSTMYDNSITAFNINALQDTIASYAQRGESLSDFFGSQKLYGQMTKYDQYGDDGTTLDKDKIKGPYSGWFKNIWANVSTTHANMHYSGNPGTKTSIFRLSSAGIVSNDIEFKTGSLNFGALGSYITADFLDYNSRGHVFEIYSRYRNKLADFMLMLNYGAIQTNLTKKDMESSWFNASANISYRLYMDETFCIQPRLGFGYTGIKAGDYYLNSTDIVAASNYNFVNLTPEIKFVKEVDENVYGSLYAKRFITFNKTKDITVNDTTYSGIDLGDYNEIGLDIEYHIYTVALSGNIRKQLGGVDGWFSGINFKYEF